jgi:murein biosynthesis integral membrane protein MurJ
MSQPLQPLDTGTSQPLTSTTAHMAAIRMKSANKYIFRALLSLASASLLVRVMGLLNLIVVTANFGQGSTMDAYYAAILLPTTLAQLLGSGLEASVIPVYTRVLAKEGHKQASRLFSTLLNLLIIGLALFTGFMLLFPHLMIFLSGPDLSKSTQAIGVSLAPFAFPMLLFMSLNSFMECLLNSEGQFGWPAYAGVLVPLTTVTFVLIGARSAGVIMLCAGTLAGQILQLCVILIRAHRARLVYRPVLDIRNPELAAIGLVAWPALFGALISQASPLVDQIFASTLTAGSIAALNNANKLIGVITGVLLSSVGRAALPYLASQAQAKNMKAFKETLRLYLWAIGLGTLLLTLGVIVLIHPLTRLVLEHGQFTEADANITSWTMIGLAIGLMPMAIGFIVARAFSALGKTKVLMYISIFSVFANAIFDDIFAHFWQTFGIALATSAVYCCTMLILLFTLRGMIGKLYLFTPPREVLKVLWRVGLGQYYIDWVIWREEHSLERWPYGFKKNVIRVAVAAAVFIGGIVGSVLDAALTVRIALGSIIIMAFLRYRYILLIVWVLLNAFIGSNLPFFSGQNFLSGLTLPTLLLLFLQPTKEAFKRMVVLPIFLAYLIWVFCGIGLTPLSLTQFFTDWTILLDSIGVAVLTIFVVSDRKRMLWLIDAILVPSIFIALYGIYGYFVKKNGVVDTSTSFFRISSIFGNTPPTLALFLSIVIPLSIYRTFTLQGWRRLPGLAVVLLLVTTLGLTFTRAALLSVPASIILMIIFLPSRRLKMGVLAGMAAVGALVILAATVADTPIFSRFLNSDVLTLNGRVYLWQAILDHFDPTQLLGNGLHSSDTLLANLQVGFGLGVIATATHNIFLESMYESGLIGLTLLIFTFAAFAIPLLRKVRNANADYRMLLAMAIAILFNVIVQSIESNDFWNPSVGLYFWIIMALPFAIYWTPAHTQVEPTAATATEDGSTIGTTQIQDSKQLSGVS